jgi:hypothetical protein
MRGRRRSALDLCRPFALLLLAILTGCTTSSLESRSPTPANQSLALSRGCEQLAREVDDPAVTDADDPWRKIGEYAVALGEANSNIAATRNCQAHQRERFAKGK